MRLVLLGPPGAGKGTQAVAVAKHYAVPHVSTGDIFRSNVKGGTELGREAAGYMDQGDLVPDDVVNRMVADRLEQPDAAEGFVLDGYPRTVPQAEVLDKLLDGRYAPLNAVLRFVVDAGELQRRLAERREIEGRVDDTEEAIRRRMEEYQAKTRPLEAFYAERDVLRDVDAVGAVEEVTRRTLAVLGGVRGEGVGGRSRPPAGADQGSAASSLGSGERPA